MCSMFVGIDQFGTSTPSSISGMGLINNGNNNTGSTYMYIKNYPVAWRQGVS